MAGAERLHAEAGGVEGHAFVYAIGSEDGPQKIGRSANPTARLRGLQTSSPHRLKLHATINIPATDAVAVERRAHATLSLRRLSGEWFGVTPDQAVTAVKEAAVVVAHERAERATAAEWQDEQMPLFPADPIRLGPLTGRQLRGARAMLAWKVSDAAAKAGVSPNTITRVEGDGSVNTATLKAMQGAYEAAGVRFTTDSGVRPPAAPDAE